MHSYSVLSTERNQTAVRHAQQRPTGWTHVESARSMKVAQCRRFDGYSCVSLSQFSLQAMQLRMKSHRRWWRRVDMCCWVSSSIVTVWLIDWLIQTALQITRGVRLIVYLTWDQSTVIEQNVSADGRSFGFVSDYCCNWRGQWSMTNKLWTKYERQTITNYHLQIAALIDVKHFHLLATTMKGLTDIGEKMS